MDDKRDLEPEADVEEQRHPVREGGDDPTETPMPFEANPADAAEQQAAVPIDDEDEQRPMA
ncbi:hypothetical protein B0I33_106318 [Prauserella shujinwangii]|uniref:Uncharacterized protein n=1 Tax=Prauserella shujinwangii TaxID=1453103 RepID=A0A2T0LU05_9PSEU|nr:hypothetical protein [Prauserella shujinwangii]PRX47217.1 hypothetical protein B0I33_106318 [Prauserella shujinwangii]